MDPARLQPASGRQDKYRRPVTVRVGIVVGRRLVSQGCLGYFGYRESYTGVLTGAQAGFSDLTETTGVGDTRASSARTI